MRALRITRFAKARVWIDERATEGYVTRGVIQGSVHAGVGASKDRIMGVEALVPRGGLAEYGMIGFRLVSSALDVLQCEVGYSDMSGPSWPDALATRLDNVRIGLPEEYASAVMEALSLACRDRMPPGVLSVVDAAHGLVGSSPSFFSRLTAAAVELALLDGPELQEIQMTKILKESLVG